MAKGATFQPVKLPNGWHVVDNDGFAVNNCPYPTKREALDAIKDYEREFQRDLIADRRNADRIDGYDRDDLGLSPDF